MSTNALPVDVLVLGDMMQNNHHRHPMRPNTAVRWFEVDLAGFAIRGLAWLGIVQPRKRAAGSERVEAQP